MKPFMKLCMAACAFIAIVITIGISSCKKGNGVTSSVKSELSKPKAFFEKLYQPLTDESAQTLLEDYSSLTPEEMDEFLRLKNEGELNEIEEMEESGSLGRQGINKALLEQQVKAVGEFRNELNKLSREKYGYSLNKISEAQFETLANEISKKGKYGILSINAAENSADRDLGVTACTAPPYTSLSTYVSSGGKRWYTYVRMDDDPNASVCDVEYRFDGDFKYYRPVRNADYLATGSGANLLRRYLPYSDGIDTFVLCGYNKIVLWIGPLGNLQLNMRN